MGQGMQGMSTNLHSGAVSRLWSEVRHCLDAYFIRSATHLNLAATPSKLPAESFLAKTLSDATLKSDCFKVASASSANCQRIGVGHCQPSCHLPDDISFAWTICDLMSSHALKPKHQDKDPCTPLHEPQSQSFPKCSVWLSFLTKL